MRLEDAVCREGRGAALGRVVMHAKRVTSGQADVS
jgi:hypothetical protein